MIIDNDRLNIYQKHGVLILAENTARIFIPESDSVLIRIREHQPTPFKNEELYVDVVNVVFDDIEDPSIYDKLMTPDDAKIIVDFMIKHFTKKLVVHCQAGISRSSATACAWAYLHQNKDLERDIRSSPLFYPNKHVYRLLIEEIDNRISF